MPAEIQRIATFFLTMDPPQHTMYRRLISSAFTPSNVAQIDEQIRKNAVTVVDELVGAGDIDFVAACSARLPMMTISEMLGVPASEREAVAKAAEKLFSMSDDEYSTIEERAENTINEMILLAGTGIELAKFRRRHPGDDLMTSIVNAEVDGHRLTDEEIGAFLILLASAGNDTTKQTTSHAMMALADKPGPAGLADGGLRRPDRSGGRGVRPMGHRRSCSSRGLSTEDTRTGRPADSRPATRWACSTARRTGTKPRSIDPGGFDLARSPNPHLGFGGGGPHFCLGNQLAKAELRNLFRELLSPGATGRVRRAGSAPQQFRPRDQAPPGVRSVVRIGEIMRVEVDLGKCTGHGICESIAEDVFEVHDDGSVRIHGE